MSGICGIVHFDGEPVDPAQLEKMAQAMAYRGPDGIRYWVQGNVGMAHLALHTTPESVRERQPLVSPLTGAVLVADARVDYRDELIPMLASKGYIEPKDAYGETPTDADLILAAYDCWGEDAPKYIDGDFAFAVWEAKEQRLYLARDRFGVRVVFYCQQGNRLAFGTEIKSLLALEWVPKDLNQKMLEMYPVGLGKWDKQSSVYRAIFRVLPAVYHLHDPVGFQAHSYWALDPEREIIMRDDGEYAAKFRELFTKSVHDRMRSVGRVGSALSGGLDSSSIACVARDYLIERGESPLPTFSLVFDTVPKSDERYYIEKVLETRNFEPNFIRGDLFSPLGEICQMHFHLDEPLSVPNLFMHWEMFRCAKQQNVHIFLDGIDGDTTVSHGLGRINELCQARQWFSFLNEATVAVRNFHHPFWWYMWSRGLRGMIPTSLIKFKRLLYGKGYNGEDLTGHNIRSITARSEQFAMHRASYFPMIFETANHGAAGFQIEIRFPFQDRRLVEFCLALPSNQKLRNGISRYVLHQAMQDVLPLAIQTRRNKSNLQWNFDRQFYSRDYQRIEDILKSPLIREKFVDNIFSGRLFDEIDLTERKISPIALFRVATSVLWLIQDRTFFEGVENCPKTHANN